MYITIYFLIFYNNISLFSLTYTLFTKSKNLSPLPFFFSPAPHRSDSHHTYSSPLPLAVGYISLDSGIKKTYIFHQLDRKSVYTTVQPTHNVTETKEREGVPHIKTMNITIVVWSCAVTVVCVHHCTYHAVYI